MRTTLDIEEPVIQALKERARSEGRGVGAVASELIRLGLSLPEVAAFQQAASQYGFRPFSVAPAGNLVTDEQVNSLRDDQGICGHGPVCEAGARNFTVI